MAARKRLKTEYKKILDGIPDDKKHIARNIIEELGFLEFTLGELRNEVKAHGVIEHFEQGKQKFIRESPALKAYNATVQRYSGLNKQLGDLIKKDAQPENGDLLYFINGGDDE